MHRDVLELFHPAVVRWFQESFREPTPPQVLGWPSIAEGAHTLICSPTGSGKTLAAFLYAIDEMLKQDAETDDQFQGVHTLYISPLKALANDIERNLEVPLEGIRQCARQLDEPLPELRVAVRTGDTPQQARQNMIRTPPHLLITTPESLHLLLTSIKAREMLRTVRYVIVDEIHSMCSDKRGTFLALLLERLDALTASEAVRIGLSATQRPLEDVAAFLGGVDEAGSPRPVTLVDAGMRKSIDLQVITPVDDMAALPQEDNRGPSAWPGIYDQLLEMVESHASTLIFANSRRVVERISAEMNRRAGHDFVRAHHGSVSKEQRHQIEQDLKDGLLPALVATSSMELGIDVGSIDLVCQVESPYSVASGLQRIGRAGHLVRATSKGRMIPKTRADLLMMAGMSRAMLQGEISAVRIPKNPLDVLAQQIVAMVAMDEWDVDELFARIRRAQPYQDLQVESFESVLELISGGYRTPELSSLRPRISWDRTTGTLYPMPGSRQLVVLNGGTIPDTGQYPMVLEDGKTRIGELDEEFVFERRVGETFVLGTGQWRVLDITHDRVVVSGVEEPEAMMPFWKGEGLGHDAEFGVRYGQFLRLCRTRSEDGTLEAWLREESALSDIAAENAARFVSSQLRQGGAIPTDRCILVDVFPNEAGDERMAILTPFGRSFHLSLFLALQGALRAESKEIPEAVFSNAGILFRPGPQGASKLIEDLRALRGCDVRSHLLNELENSPYFAMRFRRNAARAQLLPRARPGKRTPLWLQRLRSHELLAYASQHPNFPVVLETYREILEDELPIELLEQVVSDLEQGEIQLAIRKDRGPSPFSSMLLLDFAGLYLYEDDRPVPRGRTMAEARSGLDVLLGTAGPASSALFDEEALEQVEARLQALTPRTSARNGIEAVELLRRIGDLSRVELEARCTEQSRAVLDDLIADGRIVRAPLIGTAIDPRWVAAEDESRYERMSADDVAWIVGRFVMHHAASSEQEILERYPMAEPILGELPERLGWSEIELQDGRTAWSTPEVVAGLRRATLGRRRKRVRLVAPETYAEALMRWHSMHAPLASSELMSALVQLTGCRFTMASWDDVLRQRVGGYRRELLEELARSGAIVWTGWAEGQKHRTLQISPSDRRQSHLQMPWSELSVTAQRVAQSLQVSGALFLHQIASRVTLAPSEVAEALWELMWAGWVANDSIQVATAGKPRSDARVQPSRRPGAQAGRWLIVEATNVDAEEGVRQGIMSLLNRYGVVCRDIFRSDETSPAWRDAYRLLTRMEWAGEVERAYFVSGMSSPQFARRAMRDLLQTPTHGLEPKLLQVSDPACAFGRLFPVLQLDGSRYIIRHHPGNYLVIRDGRPVLSVEQRGQRLVSLAELNPAELQSALLTLDALTMDRTQPASIRVETFDNEPVLRSAAASVLSELGFSREDQGMVRYRDF